jgi:Ser/Thr protein kinase RdoA (MazF antagonist)
VVAAIITDVIGRDVGDLVARGNTSDVFDWARDAVVKLLRPGIPPEWAGREATITQLVNASGFPAPTVLDTVTIEGRPGIVFERITGISMWDEMLAHPSRIPQLSRTLANLQAELNSLPAPPGMPELHDRLAMNIAVASLLPPVERAAAQQALDGLPRGVSLCHFDVHPNNVLLGPDGPVLIDWFDAAAGAPAADIVRTSLLLRHGPASGYLHDATAEIVARIHADYLRRTFEIRELEDAALLAWEAPIVASRLAEPVPTEVPLRMWRRSRLAGGSLLDEAIQLARNPSEGDQFS